MSSHSKNIDVPFAAQVVVTDDLAIHIINLEADVMCLYTLVDLGRARDENILPKATYISQI